MSSAHIPTIQTYTHFQSESERKTERCIGAFCAKRKQSGFILCAVHAIRGESCGGGERESGIMDFAGQAV